MAGNGELTIKWSGRERTFATDVVIQIGRDPSADVVLDSTAVSRRHAEIRNDNGRWVLSDLGSTQGTFRDGRRVSTLVLDRPTSVVLGTGDRAETVEIVVANAAATLGDVATEIPSNGPSQAPPLAAPTELPTPNRPGGQLRAETLAGATVVTGDALNVECAGRSYTFEPGREFVIGRDDDCDIVSANPTVSRHHGRFVHSGSADSGWRYDDLGSSGGSYVDGRRSTSVPLQGSTAIWLGDPDTGERVVAVAAGTRRDTVTRKMERATRRGPALLLGVGVAVVAALIASVVAGAALLGSDDSPNAEELAQSAVSIIAGDIGGSGSIIDAERGLILTNAHVVDPRAPGLGLDSGEQVDYPDAPREVFVAVSRGLDRAAEMKYIAEVVASDGYLDLAVIKITKTNTGALLEEGDLEGLDEIEIGRSGDVRTGDGVRVVGYPGIAESKNPTLTQGVVASAVQDDRLGTNRAYLNVDADVNPGNSGGMAVDDDGRLIGVPTLTNLQRSTLSKANRIRPVDFANDLIEAARGGKDYTSPYVTPATGEETIQQFRFGTLGTTEGIRLDCSSEPSDGPRGDELALSFNYGGFPADKHQDMRVTLVDVGAGEVLGQASTAPGDYPIEWPEAGCVTASMVLSDLFVPTKEYRIAVYLGGSFTPYATATINAG